VFPLEVDKAIQTGGALPSDLSAGEERAIERLGPHTSTRRMP
jgi:hypothetical protein